MAKETILGISPGTRYVGLAILRDGALLDYMVKSYKGAWTDGKMQKAIKYLKTVLEGRTVHYIACKVPHEARSSERIILLISCIKELAKDYGIECFVYSIAELKGYFAGDIVNKSELAAHLTETYPELKVVQYSDDASTNEYYIRMFEAVAAGIHCYHGITG